MKRVKFFSVTFQVMITLFSSILFLYACSSPDQPFVQTPDGVHFMSGTPEQAFEQGKKENKAVFLFAHASYCASCKKMKLSVFPDKAVGDVFNPKFINAEVDIESEAGKKIVDRFNIEGTPTLLFLQPGGQLIKKISGYESSEELVALAKDLGTDGVRQN